ncbi:hypothetical protein BFW25_02100 [Aeromonas caviae]|nr:hypothetical protein BFW25_02100 [Aeromonas caviae]
MAVVLQQFREHGDGGHAREGVTEEGEILLNEINTFPGMTSISMFPKLLEHHGHSFAHYLEQILRKAV